jgi:hypothetical protein
MTKLHVSTFIPGTQKEVYTFVTAYGSEGVADPTKFTEKHGQIVQSEGNIITTKDSQAGYDLTWRCTFSYPNKRLMEAIDSNWAHRTDFFTMANLGTQWAITWETNRGGPAGGVQSLFFHFFTKKRVYQSSINPVIQHFTKLNNP